MKCETCGEYRVVDNTTLVGGLLGGSLTGGVLGDLLEDTDDSIL